MTHLATSPSVRTDTYLPARRGQYSHDYLQLATGGRSRPRKKWCVEIDRRIETMMQKFEDSTISLTDYLFGLSYLVCASVTDS